MPLQTHSFLIKKSDLLHILVVTFILLLTYILNDSLTSHGIVVLATISSAALILIAIKAFRKNALFLIYTLCLMLFHFGQVWLIFFNANIDNLYTNTYASLFQTSDFYKAIIYSLIVCCAVIIGGLLCNGEDYDENETVKYENYSISFTSVFWLLFLMISAFTIYRDILQAISVQTNGYLGAFNYDTGILARMTFFFNFASIALLMLLEKRTKKKLFVFLVIRQLFIMFIVGRRMDAITFIIIYSVMMVKDVDRERKRKFYGLIVAIAILLVFAVPFITYSRTDITDMSFLSFSLKNNPIVLILEEFGGTLSTVTLTVNYTISHGFQWGLQYLKCILGIIPFSSKFIPGLTTGTAFASTLNRTYHINGLGGSSIAEVYFNFGGNIALTVIASIIFGFIVGKTIQNYKKNSSLLARIFFIYVYAYLLQMIRDSMYGLVSALSNGIIIFIICCFLKKYLIIIRTND